MEDKLRIIKVSENSLEAFATYDNDFYDITLLPLAATNNIIIKCDADRRFTLDDMALVLEKIIINKTELGQRIQAVGLAASNNHVVADEGQFARAGFSDATCRASH